MPVSNPLQTARKRNIEQIRAWAYKLGLETEKDPEKIANARVELERKAQIVLGCTKAKAKEYLDIILGED